MTEQLILSKINLLTSESLKGELLFYLDYLLSRQSEQREKKIIKKTPQFGCAKGKFKMSADFDEPLDDFKEYMP